MTAGTTTRTLLAAAFAVLVLVVLALVSVAGAHSYTHGTISIGHIWAPPQPDTAHGAVVFGVVVNRGERTEALVGASSPAANAAHLRVSKDGEAKLLESIDLLPGKPYALAPWSGHIWLEGLKDPLEAGDRVPLTLDFGPSGTVDVEVVVEESPSD